MGKVPTPHEVVTVEWEGRPVDAFVPAPLAELGPLGASAQRAAARAERMLSASAVQHDSRVEVAARLLRPSEGVASSRIEAINAPAELVAVADVDPSVSGPAAWVADDLRAVDAALAHDGPLTFEALRDWHGILMASADLDDQHMGAWRDRLGWVGGPTPQRAAHVATPADRIEVLMGDLVEYANGPVHDPVTATALVHAHSRRSTPSPTVTAASGGSSSARCFIGAWL